MKLWYKRVRSIAQQWQHNIKHVSIIFFGFLESIAMWHRCQDQIVSPAVSPFDQWHCLIMAGIKVMRFYPGDGLKQSVELLCFIMFFAKYGRITQNQRFFSPRGSASTSGLNRHHQHRSRPMAFRCTTLIAWWTTLNATCRGDVSKGIHFTFNGICHISYYVYVVIVMITTSITIINIVNIMNIVY